MFSWVRAKAAEETHMGNDRKTKSWHSRFPLLASPRRRTSVIMAFAVSASCNSAFADAANYHSASADVPPLKIGSKREYVHTPLLP